MTCIYKYNNILGTLPKNIVDVVAHNIIDVKKSVNIDDFKKHIKIYLKSDEPIVKFKVVIVKNKKVYLEEVFYLQRELISSTFFYKKFNVKKLNHVDKSYNNIIIPEKTIYIE